MERFRIVFLVFSLFVISSGVVAEESYYLERLSLRSKPSKICFFVAYQKDRLVEDCNSRSFKMGEKDGELSFLVLHNLKQESVEKIQYLWSIYYLEDGLLLSTKLHVLQSDRLFSADMSKVLLSESNALSKQLENLESLSRKLDGELVEYFNSSSAKNQLLKIIDVRDREEKKVLDELFLRVGSPQNKILSSEGKGRDLRGVLSEELKRIVEGSVR